MKILIIGNGFDIAHGLPTSYGDFLDFMNEFAEYYEWSLHPDSSNSGVNKKFTSNIRDMFQTSKELVKELHELSEQNKWLKHFHKIYLDNIKIGKGNWVDFEREISEVVQEMENARARICSGLKGGKSMAHLSNKDIILAKDFFSPNQGFSSIERFDKIKNDCLDDLNKLTRCFEIYLLKVVENIPIAKKLQDKEQFEDVDYVLSFNYTDTFRRVYGKNKNIKYCFVHGKANINHTFDTCDLVLGIDEYLDEEMKNKNTEFIQFKKYFQRVFKKTGSEYRDWINENKYMARGLGLKDSDLKIFIFGHSLDETDKDILQFMIDNPYSYVSIFYHDKEAQGRLIANMVKIIGQDNLINRVHGNDANIFFIEQKV